MTAPAQGIFRSLNGFNYRIWAGGALVSNVGTWMQRIAQDWLVLTELTHNNATAVGVVMALQFGPQLLLLPVDGLRRRSSRSAQAADRHPGGDGRAGAGAGHPDRHRRSSSCGTSMCSRSCWAASTAFDSPARQTFVAELVGEADLSNAVALNSTSFNAARMIGPAVAGVLIAAVGSGWVFLINAASFVAVLCSLALLRVGELHRSARAQPTRGSLVEGFRYVWKRADLKAIMLMLFLIGTFGLNFPIFISTMSVTVFHAGAGQYGLLIVDHGDRIGRRRAARRRPGNAALRAAARRAPRCSDSAARWPRSMPNYWLFGAALVVIGVSAQTFTNSTNSLVQLSTEPAMRGRVMAIRLAIALGGTPMGAPIVGWVADAFGPRWALGVGAAAGFAAALVALAYLAKRRRAEAHRGLTQS